MKPASNKKRGRGGRERKNGDVRTDYTALSYALAFYKACDTAVSLSLFLMIKNKEFKQVVEKRINPSDYSDVATFFVDYQCTKLLAKCVDFKTGVKLREVAVKSFIEAEEACETSNEIIRQRWAGNFQFSRPVSAVLYLAQRKIADILGDVPTLSELDFAFGPGANVSVKGDTSTQRKLSTTLECDFAFTPLLEEFLAEFPSWLPDGGYSVNIADGAELTFVPKSAKTERPICIEPLLNGLYQKGIGTLMKQKLLKEGINLYDQSINQLMALHGVKRKLATVDFSSASDMICYNIVLDLYPPEWFKLLDYGRSQRFTYAGHNIGLQKFSSMGNATTFESESTIFYAIAWACMKYAGATPLPSKNLSVFGDDVILPIENVDLFKEVTRAIGFKVNEDKSYVSGQFRESCGVDSFMGYDVTPFKIESLKGRQDVYKTANQLLKIIEKLLPLPNSDGLSGERVARLWDLHGRVVGSIPRHLRFTIPANAGDGGFHAPFDVAVPKRAGRQIDGWYTKGLQWESSKGRCESVPLGLPTWGRGSRTDLALGEGRAYKAHGPTYRTLVEIQDTSKVSKPYPSDELIINDEYNTRENWVSNVYEYSLRGRGRFVVRQVLIRGQWVDPGVPWGDRALGLVAKRRDSGKAQIANACGKCTTRTKK